MFLIYIYMNLWKHLGWNRNQQVWNTTAWLNVNQCLVHYASWNWTGGPTDWQTCFQSLNLLAKSTCPKNGWFNNVIVMFNIVWYGFNTKQTTSNHPLVQTGTPRDVRDPLRLMWGGVTQPMLWIGRLGQGRQWSCLMFIPMNVVMVII
jgi:hypothetical protein